MHVVMLELQEANKDVLVGKRNFNCLSCGVKDGESQPFQPKIKSAIQGNDGRLYRGNLAELTEVAPSHKRYQSRVASAHPRANRIVSSMAKDGINEASGGSSVFNTTLNERFNAQNAPYGISAEVRMR